MPLSYVHRSSDGYTRCWPCFVDGQHADNCGVHSNPEMGRCTCALASKYITHRTGNGYNRHAADSERDCEYCRRAEEQARMKAAPKALTVDEVLTAAKDENALQALEIQAGLSVLGQRDQEIRELRTTYEKLAERYAQAALIADAAQSVSTESRRLKARVLELEGHTEIVFQSEQAALKDCREMRVRVQELETEVEAYEGNAVVMVQRIRELEAQVAALRLTGGTPEPAARRGRPPKAPDALAAGERIPATIS